MVKLYIYEMHVHFDLSTDEWDTLVGTFDTEAEAKAYMADHPLPPTHITRAWWGLVNDGQTYWIERL